MAPNIVIFNLTYSILAAVQYAVELLEIINSFSTLLKILYVITALPATDFKYEAGADEIR